MAKSWQALVALAMLVFTAAACGNAPNDEVTLNAQDGANGGAQSGAIEIDGSSTVAPITDAVAEEFAAEEPDVTVNVGVSGTGGGFERFCAGETDISNASRPIKDEETKICADNGVEFVELPIGTDALTMVTSPDTDFVTCLTTDEVAKIFGPDDPASTWADVNPSFPDNQLRVFAPGTDSGTYDFMVEDVLDIEAARQDYEASENDNIIAQGVQGTPGSWGFFGFAYYQESQDTLKAIEFDAGEGCVAPSIEAAQDGSYKMTRPLFIYLNTEAVQRPEVEEFVTFYLDQAEALVPEVGYIPVPSYDEVRQTFEEAVGS